MGNELLKLVISLGLSIVTCSLILLAYNSRKSRKFKLNNNLKKIFFIKELQFKTDKLLEESRKNKNRSLIRLAIAVFFALGLGRNWMEFLQFFLLGYIIAFFVTTLIIKVRKDMVKNKKMKEIAILFEAIELYMKGGYSLPQALRLSRSLTPNLEKAINICLDYWAAGPKEALEKFKQELDLEEGEILVSLLIHMETAGTKNLSGILGREAFNVERLRRLRTEVKVSMRPLYLMVYRFLPLVSALGLITGPLLYRTYMVLVDAGLLWFR